MFKKTFIVPLLLIAVLSLSISPVFAAKLRKKRDPNWKPPAPTGFNAQAAATLEPPPKSKSTDNKKSMIKKIENSANNKKQEIKQEAEIKITEFTSNQANKYLSEIYKNTDLTATVQQVTDKLNSYITNGPKLTNSQVEESLRGIFGDAVNDTGAFAQNLLKSHNLQTLVNNCIAKPKSCGTKESLDALHAEIKAQIKEYAKQEVNKIANQVVDHFIPVLQGVDINFTDLNKKNIKANLRQIAINALAQSYLGPEYLIAYAVFETLFPKQAAQVHAELRRFDKKYLQPTTGAIQEGIDSAIEKTSAEAKRFGKRVDKEVNREIKDVKKALNGAKKAVKKLKKKIKI